MRVCPNDSCLCPLAGLGAPQCAQDRAIEQEQGRERGMLPEGGAKHPGQG